MAKLLPPKPTLKEEHECLRGLIENSDLGFYRLDTEGRIVEWNATLVDMLGLFADQAEISGRPIWTFVDKDESERFRAAVKRQLKNLDTVFEPAAVTFIGSSGLSVLW